MKKKKNQEDRIEDYLYIGEKVKGIRKTITLYGDKYKKYSKTENQKDSWTKNKHVH